jgi:hypothetical protein
MSKLSFVIVALVLAMAQAFVPASQVRTPAAFVAKESSAFALNMAEDTYWEGEYPPSKVLGPLMSKMPSGVLGVLSLVFLTACATSCYQSSLLQQEPNAIADGSWVKWYYVLAGFGGPLAWGVSNNQSLRFDSIHSLVWLCFQAGFRVKSITAVWHF